MTSPTLSGPHWTTSCLHEPLVGASDEIGALAQHVNQCLGRRRRLFVLLCGADSMHAFVACRFVSTLAVLALLAALGSWFW